MDMYSIMKVNFKALLKNEKVMYVVLFIAAMSAFGYLMARNVEAITLMAAVGFLTWNFSKNMTIVLGTALLVTNMVYGVRRFEGFKEGVGPEESEGSEGPERPERPEGQETVQERPMRQDNDSDFISAFALQEKFSNNLSALEPMLGRLENLAAKTTKAKTR